jgi:uncharacterized protein (TIGR00725 family)
VEAKRVSVFGSATSQPGHPDYEEARRLGRLLAEAGYAVCTGGYMGAMGAVSQGAHEAGGHVVGVTVTPWGAERAPNPWLKEEIATANLHERLEQLIASDALIAVHGGVGTLVEVALAWNLLQRDMLPARPPLVLVGVAWQQAIAGLAATLVISAADVAMLTLVDSPDAAVTFLQERLS